MLSNFGKLNCEPPLRLIFVLSRFVTLLVGSAAPFDSVRLEPLRFVTLGALKPWVLSVSVIDAFVNDSKTGAETLPPSLILTEPPLQLVRLGNAKL